MGPFTRSTLTSGRPAPLSDGRFSMKCVQDGIRFCSGCSGDDTRSDDPAERTRSSHSVGSITLLSMKQNFYPHNPEKK